MICYNVEVARKYAVTNARRRAIIEFHEGYYRQPQVFANILMHDTFIDIHNHELDGLDETIVICEGRVGVLTFNEYFEIEDHVLLDVRSDKKCVTISSFELHTVVCLSEVAMIIEIKKGPYDQSTGKKIFATRDELYEIGITLDSLKKKFNDSQSK